MASSTLATEASVRRLMETAVAEGVFPGGVLLAARGEDPLVHGAWGVADLSTGQPVARETVFDLASLTKPLATAAAVMRLVQTGRLALETPMAELLPDMAATDKAGVTVRHLLSHCGGWPAWQPYFERLRLHPPERRRALLASYLAEEPLINAPGDVFLYSDLDFLALGLAVEARTGERLDRFVAREIYQPLGIADLFFNALDREPAERTYAATERCPWRGRVLAGEVHDDNAHVLDGVAGHAGLFGTARGVFVLLRALLRIYREESRDSIVAPRLLQTFWTRQKGSGWTLGFDTPSPQTSSAGRYFSKNSVGHLGFTGTSFWVDIDRSIIVILLTNRVHPSRANAKIRGFRPLVHDTIMKGLLSLG